MFSDSCRLPPSAIWKIQVGTSSAFSAKFEFPLSAMYMEYLVMSVFRSATRISIFRYLKSCFRVPLLFCALLEKLEFHFSSNLIRNNYIFFFYPFLSIHIYVMYILRMLFCRFAWSPASNEKGLCKFLWHVKRAVKCLELTLGKLS